MANGSNHAEAGPIKEYVLKRVVASENWGLILEDWLKINKAL
jgi:hypothetical protein